MRKQSRFIKAIIATASEDHPPLPFQRGAPRKAMIARREAPKTLLKRA
ncbi:hypothetical protein [Tropicibacter sp. S64]